MADTTTTSEHGRPAEKDVGYHKVAFDSGGFFCLYCGWSGTFIAEAFEHDRSNR